MKTAVVITSGNTAQPILKAIEDAAQEGEEVMVYLIYGKPFPQQSPSTLDVANEAGKKATALRIGFDSFQVDNPESIDSALFTAKKVFEKLTTTEKVIVNYTGGTKVLSAAVVHQALMAQLSGQLLLDYTGGIVRNEKGHATSGEMRVNRTATDELIHQIIGLLKRTRYQSANLLAERLPDRGKGHFVKYATEALYCWDEFNYQDASPIFTKHLDTAKTLAHDAEVGTLASLILKCQKPVETLNGLVRRLHTAESNPKSFSLKIEEIALLVADTIENGLRRLEQGRPTDSIMRFYRAIEVATQGQLLINQINPWQPQWNSLSEELQKKCKEKLEHQDFPRDITLQRGIRLLEIFDISLSPEMQLSLQEILQQRNRSYLEHGYQRVPMDSAKKFHPNVISICEALLGTSLKEALLTICHIM